MKKNLTRISLLLVVVLCTNHFLKGQITIVWPSTTADTVISQFANANTIFKATQAIPNPPTGFSGWISKPIACADMTRLDSAQWEWKAPASPPGGTYGIPNDILSETPQNGTAVFNSDLLDTRGIAGNFGGGAAPAPQTVELISPIINTEGIANITIEFNQYYRNYASNCYLYYSTDGGTTWSSPFEVNASTTINTSTPNTSVTTSKKRVILAGSRGTANFRFKFVWRGDYYFWIIDDVKVLNYTVRDLAINPNFVAIPPSLYAPRNHIEPINFMADVMNIGTLPQYNTRLEVRIRNPAGIIFNTVTNQFPNIFPIDTIMQNRILPTAYTPTVLGKYTGYYRVFGDSLDSNPANDTFHFSFWASDTSTARAVVVPNVGTANFSKEDASIALTRNANNFWLPNEPHSWRVGNFYRSKTYIFRERVTSLTTRLNAKAAAGTPLQASIYKWVDSNQDGVVNENERTLVALGDTLVPINTPNIATWFRFPMRDNITGSDFFFEHNTSYIAVIEWDAPASTITCTSDSCYLLSGFSLDKYNYGAMKFLTDSLRNPRFTTILGKTATGDWTTTGFTNQSLVPVVRLTVIGFSPTRDLLDNRYKMLVFPNPSTENIAKIQIQMPKTQQILLQIYRIDGCFMAEQVIDDAIDKQEIQIDVSDYSDGLYIAKIITAEGNMSKEFIVNHK